MVDAYFARDPIRIVVELHSEDHFRFKFWRARIAESPPTEMSPVIGDILHNLRSALDLMACDAVRLAGKSDKGTYFPFSNTAAELPEQIRRKNFDRAGSRAVRLLKQIRPHRNGNEGLRALHDLSNQDKHQMVVPVAWGGRLDLSGLMPDADPKTFNEIKNWSSRLEDGSIVVGTPLDYGPPVGAIVKADYFLLLFYPETGAGNEMVHFLDELCRVVENILKLFSGEADEISS
ncbi:hypothetical protein [Propylenella binzhouense]|uniref:Uncharacterized protein n=1 Tax=Propylenella binzhouense TaxID=2555902 RepID=A0A964WVZ1_9HYPH|nr:hypothetical protein [Propylenella binzhouense]MYZ50330.1 hypothetical protein [Propylenella binzhouense]